MSERINELFLFDIYIAILKIENVSSKYMKPDELLYDFVSWDSIIREFEIIGEAVNILLKSGLLEPENRVIVDFRNLLIHNYFGVDAEEVWNVVKDDLCDFKMVVLQKINNINRELRTEIITSLREEFGYLEFVDRKLNELL